MWAQFWRIAKWNARTKTPLRAQQWNKAVMLDAWLSTVLPLVWWMIFQRAMCKRWWCLSGCVFSEQKVSQLQIANYSDLCSHLLNSKSRIMIHVNLLQWLNEIIGMSFVGLLKCEEELGSSRDGLCCDVVHFGHATYFTRHKNSLITSLNVNANSSSRDAEVVYRFNITQSWNRSRSSAWSLTNAILQPSVNHENSFWCFHCSTGENFLGARAKTFLKETSHISLLLLFYSFSVFEILSIHG